MSQVSFIMDSLPTSDIVNDTVFVVKDIKGNEDGGETTVDIAQELTYVEEEDFQQISSVRWLLKNFKSLYKSYMDNESREYGEEERSALRTFLLHSGDRIGCPSTFILTLFTKFAEFNQNEGENSEDIAVEVTIKLVDCPPHELQLFSSFKVKLCSQDEVELCHFYQPIYAAKPRSTVTLAGTFHWGKEKSKLADKETLLVDVEHCIYRHPMEWGLSSKALDMLVSSPSGNINKSEELGDSGVIECLERI